jgi:hypothetical protein
MAGCILASAGCGGPLQLEVHGEPGAMELFGVPNLDDDESDREVDFLSEKATDEERTSIIVPVSALKHGKGAAELEARLEDLEGQTRVWFDGELVLGKDGDSWTLPESDEPLTLRVEFGTTATHSRLRLVELNGAGEEVDATRVELYSSPVLLQHHLRPVEQVWLMDVDDGDYYENQQMVGAYRDALGEVVTFVDDERHGFDVWVQDEMQLGALTAPDGQRNSYVLDSIRDGGLDRLPKSLEGDDMPRQTHGNWRDASTYDSFGNLEVSPPVTVDGIFYPYGRIYYGDRGPFGPTDRVKAFLDKQRVQAPIQLDTSWLCVGHVDEYVSFLPDPTAPKGFRVALADTTEAMAFFEGLDPGLELPRYGGAGIDIGHDRPDVASIIDDAALWALNEDVQRDHLDPIRAQLKRDLGLEEGDFINFPTLFEVAPFCDGAVVAMTPGMVNLVVTEVEGTTHVFMADPFVRNSGSVDTQDDDPLISLIRDRLPAGLVPHFVDNWFVYHMGMGEVHCGTNTLRTPTGAWWDDARHLLEE